MMKQILGAWICIMVVIFIFAAIILFFQSEKNKRENIYLVKKANADWCLAICHNRVDTYRHLSNGEETCECMER